MPSSHATTIPREIAAIAASMVDAIAQARSEGLASWQDDRFDELALKVYAAQRMRVQPYAQWCDTALDGAEVRGWKQVPALPIAAFKRLRVAAHEPADDVATWHSSTTTGHAPSRHVLPSTALYEASLGAAAGAALAPDAGQVPLHAVQLMPAARDLPDSSLAHMFDEVRTTLCASGDVCARRADQVDVDAAWRSLRQAAQAEVPVLVLATSFALVHLFEAGDERLELAAGSRVMDTGGYKGRSREYTRADLVETIGKRLGIAPGWCDNEYGMSELSSQAYLGTIAASAGHALAGTDETNLVRWQPPWFRTRVVDPVTLDEVADGERGLLVHHDLANVYSCAAIRTDDVGVRRGTSYEFVGRAPGAELRGCSLRLEDVFGE